MPLPSPKEGESQNDFVSQCMSNPTMKKDFPKKKQRLAVCHSQFKRKKEGTVMELKQFEAPFELRQVDEDAGIFEGYAAVFNKPDQYSDVILPGAFKKSLHKHPKRKVKMLRQHDQRSIIGTFLEIKEDDKGLLVKGQLLLGIQAAAESFLLLKAGALDSLSIGFRTIVDEYDEKKHIRSIIELMLFEISLVAIPAQLGATITSVKEIRPEEITNARDLERALRDAGHSRAVSKFITAGWTPPARRDDEGGDDNDDMVSRIRQLASIITATGG